MLLPSFDQEFKFCRLINRNVTRFGTVQDFVHVIGQPPEQLRKIEGITHQRAGFDVIACLR